MVQKCLRINVSCEQHLFSSNVKPEAADYGEIRTKSEERIQKAEANAKSSKTIKIRMSSLRILQNANNSRKHRPKQPQMADLVILCEKHIKTEQVKTEFAEHQEENPDDRRKRVLEA